MTKNLSYTINLDADLGNLESKLGSIKGMFSKLTANGGHPEILQMFN
jgi:hypothetical protein